MLMKSMIILVLALSVLAGCNTMRGVGQDVEKAGEAIQRKANK
jgi:predicted small secreted protein